jgi:ribosome biogenesis protein Tsr3
MVSMVPSMAVRKGRRRYGRYPVSTTWQRSGQANCLAAQRESGRKLPGKPAARAVHYGAALRKVRIDETIVQLMQLTSHQDTARLLRDDRFQ